MMLQQICKTPELQRSQGYIIVTNIVLVIAGARMASQGSFGFIRVAHLSRDARDTREQKFFGKYVHVNIVFTIVEH